MELLRTPDSRFENIADYPFAPHYLEVDDTEGGRLRVHYLAEGPEEGPVVLLMHGQPAWSYLYRHMIPLLVARGYRVYAPDFVGFGKSDKPTLPGDYTYARHVRWMGDWLEQLQLKQITLFCQDWGSLIGLRLLTTFPDRFAGVVLSNGGLPAGYVPCGMNWFMRRLYQRLPVVKKEQLVGLFEASASKPWSSVPGMFYWRKFCAESDDFDIGQVILQFDSRSMGDAEIAAYNAPYPDDSHKAGARRFPSLVPILLDDAETAANRKAWRVLEQFDKPFMCAFSDGDPVTGAMKGTMLKRVPGCQGVRHRTIKNAGHFPQQEQPEQCVQAIQQLYT